VICPFTLQVPPERYLPAVDAINRVNHAIALPGFALDPDKAFMYFRLTVQRDDDGGLLVEMLRRMIRAAVNNASEFVVALRGVALEGAPPEGVLAAAIAAAAAAQAQAQAQAQEAPASDKPS
jgi:hypothetical protein